MKLPYKPTNVDHKHGGKIVEITGVSHETDRQKDGYSRDFWYFLGQVKWDDTGKVGKPDRHLYPYDLCADTKEGHDEINGLLSLMNAYLAEHGEWRESKPKGWYAHRKVKAAA